ncbi:unnamed protein product [Scytosiphon promiscuus]
MASPAASTLPPLVETFPADKYPLREIGQGFTAQACQGEEAQACALTAAEMLDESRTFAVSSVSSENNAVAGGPESFTVSDLPLPEGAAKTGMLILRNERIFPGMVGISLPQKGNLWVREDGTFNLSGFFRRQIPKFKTGLLMAAKADIANNLDVFHAVYRPVVEASPPRNAAQRLQFQVLRTVLETGLGYYKEDSPARRELLELRSRVSKLRSRSSSGGSTRESVDAITAAAAAATVAGEGASTTPNPEHMSTEDFMETRRRISDSKIDEKESSRRASSLCSDDPGGDMTVGSRGDRASGAESGSERKLKASFRIAQQVTAGNAPKQKEPFRLWKSKTGEESYDKSKPS